MRFITTPAAPSRRYRTFCRYALAVLLLLAALFNGSVSAPYSQITGFLAALLVVLCLLVEITSTEIRRLLITAACLLGGAAAWVIVQVLPLPLGLLGHPIWQSVSTLVPVDAGYLSINPNRTLSALPALLMPGLIFICTALLCQSSQGGKRTWHLLALVGAAIVLISIVLEAFFPEVALFSTYQIGHGSFSGVFVNRNVSAAFFGLTGFALAGSAMIHSANRQHHASNAPPRPPIWPVLIWLMFFVTLIAILATRSRAGSMLSLPLLFFCLAITFAKARQQHKIAHVLAVLAGGGALMVLFGEPVFSRLDGLSQDYRWCAWASTLQGIQEHPWAGTGFATFYDAFPQYRDPSCLGTEGSWHRAHNSFLELALGIGLPATVLLLGITYRMLIQSGLTGLRRRRSLRAIPILTLGALGFVSFHSLVDFPLQIPGVASYFAALMGAGSAISVQNRGARRADLRNLNS